jgi:PAS domain-containing protein
MNAARSVDGWRSLFSVAFNLSANPMILLQRDRVLVDVNGAFLEAFGSGERARSGASWTSSSPRSPASE